MQGGMLQVQATLVTLDSRGMPVAHQPNCWRLIPELHKVHTLLPVATVVQVLLPMATHAPLDKGNICQVRTAIASTADTSVTLQELACSLGCI
jgi:hypothetical protein